ncbi:cupin domain-containing protein [Thalassomonas sp. M1454]|uniref:cupin domain-containing protein n=1 Tax=Thalassomonas sp. M1454 TaxID=2594477 RepID=UPI001180751F|nr:cupin domain-containing protein [Thalassomonas sp. M1454]TRX57850.1 DUF861 domain-containing protein [Thalassomonas sp. M1454]
MTNQIISLSAYPEGFHDEADELTADMFASDIPLQHSHDYYCDEDLGLYVGVWDTDTMDETPGPYGMEEFMVVLEGQAQIKNNKTGNIETIKAGEGFVIPKGYDCQWQQQGYLKKFYVILDNDTLAPGNSEVDSVALFKTSQTNKVFINEQNTFKAGICNSTEYIKANNEHRFIYVLSGSLTVKSSSHKEQTFTASESIFIKNNEHLDCNISDDFKAYFCNVVV